MTRSFKLFLVALALVCSPLLAQNSEANSGHAAAAPEIPFDSVPHFLKTTNDYPMGEAAGVATNSKGDIFVYTRSGLLSYTVGTSRQFRRGASARLYEFDPNGNFIREIGQGTYAEAFAHAVRVDAHDNIWIVDEGSNMVVEFSPDGSKVLNTLGRSPEAFAEIPGRAPEGRATPAGRGESGAGFSQSVFATLNRPTDIGWDPAGNMYVSDGYNNARVAKFDPDGNFIKSWGSRGTGPGQFEDVHTLQVDHQGNVYVGDRRNDRIQVFDGEGNLKTTISDVGSPWALCISPGAHQYLYSSNSTGTGDMNNGQIYKMELDGKILGRFGKGGKQLKEFMAVHSMDCRYPNQLLVAEISNWRVQKILLHPDQMQSASARH